MSTTLDTVNNPPISEVQYVVCDRNGNVGPNGQSYNFNLSSNQIAGPITSVAQNSGTGVVTITPSTGLVLPSGGASATGFWPYCNVLLNGGGSAVSISLGYPVPGRDDGKILRFIGVNAAANIVTLSSTPSQGYFNALASGGHHIATAAASDETSLNLIAFNGNWYVTGSNGITFT